MQSDLHILLRPMQRGWTGRDGSERQGFIQTHRPDDHIHPRFASSRACGCSDCL